MRKCCCVHSDENLLFIGTLREKSQLYKVFTVAIVINQQLVIKGIIIPLLHMDGRRKTSKYLTNIKFPDPLNWESIRNIKKNLENKFFKKAFY